ncbi:hypothetical protein HDU67_004246 [Dinochytrium kinnereticum]|nr:hypothetical protein HDU67_004246 [Dinochytrium kinnereticum]
MGGVWASEVGFGAYRLHSGGVDAGKLAIKTALTRGVNVVDTSAHFGSGMSEKIIGEALAELISEGALNRDEVIIVTKLGHILGSDLVAKHLQDQEDHGDGLAILSETAAHCLSPKFLEEEITKSLMRLGVQSADIVMLNNPERMIHAKNRAINRTQLLTLMRTAFSHLEKEVLRGRIRGYGVSSNTMHILTSPDHISLSSILSDAPSPSHFTAIGYPLNVFEREAVEASVTASGRPSLASQAAEAGLLQLTQRPLNAITGAGGVIRCLGDSGRKHDSVSMAIKAAEESLKAIVGEAPIPLSDDIPRPPFAEAIEKDKEEGMTDEEAKAMALLANQFEVVANLEIELGSLAGQNDMDVTSTLTWAEALSENLSSLTSNPFTTRHYVTTTVLPSLQEDVAEVSRRWSEEFSMEAQDPSSETTALYQRRREWTAQYLYGVSLLCGALVDVCVAAEQRTNRDLANVLKALAPESLGVVSGDSGVVGGMAEVAVKIARGSLDVATRIGVGEGKPFTVLVGMDRPEWAMAGKEMMMGKAPSAEELVRVFWCPLLDE